MKTVAIVSNVGGIGRTTLVAHAARMIAQRGRSVLTIDLDAQNMLGQHLGMDPASGDGISARIARGQPLDAACQRVGEGLWHLPFGHLRDPLMAPVAADLQHRGDWLRPLADALQMGPDAIALIDCPRLPCSATHSAIRFAHQTLALVAPDPTGYACLGALRALLSSAKTVHYLLNRLDPRQPVARDIVTLLSDELGDALLTDVVHEDRAVREALAAGLPLGIYAAEAQSTRDFERIAEKLSAWCAA